MMTTDPHTYNQSLIKPSANLQFLVWLVLLGVPALLLFLISGKEYEARLMDRPSQVMQQQTVDEAPALRTEHHQ